MPNKKKRQKRRPGDFFAVPLPDGDYAFGRILNDAMAFYDLKSKEIVDIEEILKANIIFKVWVTDYVITSGLYPIIGHKPLTEEEKNPLVFAKRDVLSGQYYKYIEGGTMIPSSKEDLIGLELAAVWDHDHIEERLTSYFRGEESIFYTDQIKRLFQD